MGRRTSTDRNHHPARERRHERTAATAGAVAAFVALASLASWIGGLLGPDPDARDGLDDAAALAGLGLFGLGFWLVPAAARWAGRLAGPAQVRTGLDLLDVLVLLALACALGMAALAVVLVAAYGG